MKHIIEALHRFAQVQLAALQPNALGEVFDELVTAIEALVEATAERAATPEELLSAHMQSAAPSEPDECPKCGGSVLLFPDRICCAAPPLDCNWAQWRAPQSEATAAASEIGGTIRGERVRDGKSLRETAAALGMTSMQLGEIERGARWPTVEEWSRISDLLGIAPQAADVLYRQANEKRLAEFVAPQSEAPAVPRVCICNFAGSAYATTPSDGLGDWCPLYYALRPHPPLPDAPAVPQHGGSPMTMFEIMDAEYPVVPQPSTQRQSRGAMPEPFADRTSERPAADLNAEEVTASPGRGIEHEFLSWLYNDKHAAREIGATSEQAGMGMVEAVVYWWEKFRRPQPQGADSEQLRARVSAAARTLDAILDGSRPCTLEMVQSVRSWLLTGSASTPAAAKGEGQ